MQWPPDKGPWTSLTETFGRAAFSIAAMRCIRSWEDLRRRLGEPRSILCLGNGPSSEDAGIHRAGYDRLFRVNWTWQGRTRHSNPDVVFTADLDLPPRDMPVICFPTRADANRILASYLRRRVAAHTNYLVLPELPSSLWDRKWSHRPTNGALMLAAAVHLRPSRLTIAGIDLYLHPHGKYPDATGEANEYDAIHHRDVDLGFIRAALDGFDGKVDIRGPQLRSALVT